MNTYLLAIDQGTTNSRAIIFNLGGSILSQHEIQLNQSFPHDGWVEQDPDEMFNNTVTCCREALKKLNITAKEITTVGISNQRETTIIWDRVTGKPIYPAIVWQDRRTTEICKQLSHQSMRLNLNKKTGLLLDPYFSATKIMWLLDNVPHARERADRGELAFGTVDSYLLWKFTQGKAHLTDATNASRTLLFNIHTQKWDEEILSAFNIPKSLLPNVLDSSAHFGDIHQTILGHTISITGIAGDQQAATVGQACFHPGMVKTTYGTGGFMLLNTGNDVIQSNSQLISTIAYRLENKVTYGLEGSFFSAGVTVKWLRDNLKLIKTASETEVLAKRTLDTGDIYLVPAFTGLGAPYWHPDARGALFGLTLNSGIEHIVRAALESVAYQTRDLLDAMISDSQSKLSTMRVDGGMVVNNWLLQFISDIVNLELQRPACIETSALGAVFLAGLHAGVYQSLEEISLLWKMNAQFTPQMPTTQSKDLYEGWKQAVSRTKSFC